MIDFTLVGVTEVQLQLQQAGSAVRDRIRTALAQAQNLMVNAIKDRLSDQDLHVRSGFLRRSAVAGPIVETSLSMEATVGVNGPYARLQEKGGEVVPVAGKYLTIPQELALTARGVPRFTAEEVIDDPQIAGMLHVVKIGQMIMGVDTQGNLNPLFALALRARIPAHNYMQNAINEVHDAIATLMVEAVQG